METHFNALPNKNTRRFARQRQGLALARMLLSQKPILILDEATSVLDNISERCVQKALGMHNDNRTTLLIAHRLTTLKHCDRIFVFHEGAIVQHGTYTSLTQQDGVFRDLVKSAEHGMIQSIVSGQSCSKSKFWVWPRAFPWGDSDMSAVWQTIILLILSNIFMTFAWYGHLKNLNEKPWLVAALVSWSIALLEYLLQVPANRIGKTELNLGQLKIIQEVISLSVFVPFAVWYMREPLRWNYLWAALCICGAVYFVFRQD